MPRARMLKPQFFTDEDLGELPPLARLLFAGLWSEADREGRLEDRPKRLKVQILPFDQCDVDQLLSLLASPPGCFIRRYEAEGRRFIQIRTFRRHQNPHVREPASTIPAPGEPSASTGPAPGQHQSGPAESESESESESVSPPVVPRARKPPKATRPPDPRIEAAAALTQELSGIAYPPATWDGARAVLADGASGEDLLDYLRWCATDPWCKTTVAMDPTVLFRKGRFAAGLAKARAGHRPAPPRDAFSEPQRPNRSRPPATDDDEAWIQQQLARRAQGGTT